MVLVSVVIATRNSASTLPFALASLRRQAFRDFEVIVVDNYSVDGTRDVARRFGAKVYLCGGERSRQRNYGAMVARGEYLYFMDSDFVLHGDVLADCVAEVKRGAEAVIINNLSYPRISRVSRARFYERISYIGSGFYEVVRFIAKRAFENVGGYDETLYANEDYDLYLRLVNAGVKLGRAKRSFEIHIGEPRSINEFIAKNYYYGGSLKKYFAKSENAIHALPLRHTYFKKEIIASLARNWPLGLLYIPLMRIIQGASVLVGMATFKNTNRKFNPGNYEDCRQLN